LGKSQNKSAYLWQISVDQVDLRGNRGLKRGRMSVGIRDGFPSFILCWRYLEYGGI
jgi:hypothetical protein